MAEWIFGREQGCCAWLGPRGPGKRSERRSRLKAICPHAMLSFWKVAALRLTECIRIQSGRRALRCFQNELHHFYHFKSEVVLLSLRSGFRTDFDGATESKEGRGTLCEVFLLASRYFQPISGMFSFPFKRVEAETMR